MYLSTGFVFLRIHQIHFLTFVIYISFLNFVIYILGFWGSLAHVMYQSTDLDIRHNVSIVMYLSTKLNQFPSTWLCILFYAGLAFFGRLPWRIISAGRADPVQPDFHQFITLQSVCTGGGGRGEGGHLNAKPTNFAFSPSHHVVLLCQRVPSWKPLQNIFSRDILTAVQKGRGPLLQWCFCVFLHTNILSDSSFDKGKCDEGVGR